MTKDLGNLPGARGHARALVVACCFLLLSVSALAGCSSRGAKQEAPSGQSSSNATTPPDWKSGMHMSGPALDVHVSATAIAAKPKAWDLTTPESAVRSYLDWTTYIYRIADSSVAKGAMTSGEMVRVDAYVQYNTQKQRLIEGRLDSIEFGKVSVKGTKAVLPTKEVWSYSYLSIAKGNATIAGPYSATYDTVYNLVKSSDGKWRVDSVKATPKGTVK